MNPLTRPMFRLGSRVSSDGVGITSGLNRRHYQGGEFGEQISETVEEITKKPTYGWSELMSDAYRATKGASTMKDWILQGADIALEKQDALKAKPQENLKVLLDAQKGAGEHYKATRPLEVERLKEYYDTGQKIISDLQAGMRWDDFKRSKEFSDWEFYMTQALGKGNFPTRWAVDKAAADRLAEINASRGEGMSTIAPGHPQYDQIMGQIIIDIYKPYLEKITFPTWKKGEKIGEGEWTYAKGGRVGRAFGNPDPTMNIGMTEQIDTPQGDMSMTEDVSMTEQMPGPAADDPYIMLRTRLPQEISDEVVRLIAYNPDAFADFADIETQDDVISFNQKWGVELVVNLDEV